MRRKPGVLIALSAIATTCALATLPGGAGAADTPACSYDASHPAPVKVSKLPAKVVAGRTQTVRVKARGTNGQLADTHLTALGISFERISDNAVTYTDDMLAVYKKTKPGVAIGHDVTLGTYSPGERAIVRWTDDDPGLATHPCSGEARTGDMAIVDDAQATKPVISAKAGASDAVKGDSSVLSIGGKGSGCPLTDPSKLSVVASSGGKKKTLKVTMACGFWTSSKTVFKVDGFTLLIEDGGYSGPARLYVSPRASPSSGARLTLQVKKGSTTLKTLKFHVASGRVKTG